MGPDSLYCSKWKKISKSHGVLDLGPTISNIEFVRDKHTHTDTHTDSDDYSLYIPEHKHYIIFELRHIGRYY